MPEKRAGIVATFHPNEYGIQVTEQDIEAYYESHKAQYLEKPVQLQVRRILFKVSDNTQRALVEEKARKVRQELVNNPSSFTAVAKEVSEDKKSAKQGGLLPVFLKANGTGV